MKNLNVVFLVCACMLVGTIASAGEKQERQQELQRNIDYNVQQWTHQYNETHTNAKPSDPAYQQKIENVQKLEREIQQDRRELERIRR